MAAFRRFDPYALLAEVPKQPRTLAGLAGLAGVTPGIANLADAPCEGNRDRGGNAAKVAKPAKVGRGEAGTLATLATLAAPALEIENSARWSEAEEERAAVVEYDGRIPRAWAEGFARLHPDRPSGDVPAKRWLTFVNDVGRFLDSPFCAVAAALGWGPHDLFGCDRDRPFARIDQAGLLWLLNGDHLIALTENTATIERRTGARQTYRRRPCQMPRLRRLRAERGAQVHRDRLRALALSHVTQPVPHGQPGAARAGPTTCRRQRCRDLAFRMPRKF